MSNNTSTAKLKRIVCAAVRNREGLIICGARHNDVVMRQQMNSSKSNWNKGIVEQGFIDTWGNFLTREQAWSNATENNQILRRCGGDEGRLYSENLY